jgi:hypothetical protein
MGHGITLTGQYTGDTLHCDGATGAPGDDGGGCTVGTSGNRFVAMVNLTF